jgi:8-oxo-dGTP diphosphatase
MNTEEFNNQPFKAVKTTAGGIIQRDGKVLITKRSVAFQNGKWCLPGGHIDIGETALDAVKREVKEETNLDFVNVKFFRYYDEFFPEQKFHAVVLIFYGEAKGKEKLNEESSDYRWISEEDLDDFDFLFHHKRIIREFFDWKRKEERA